MKFLIYHDEYNCLDRATDDIYTFGLINFRERIVKIFDKLADNCEIKVIMPESTKLIYEKIDDFGYELNESRKAELNNFMRKLEIVTISDEEFINCFNNKLSTTDIYVQDMSGEIDNYEKISKLVKEKIGDFDPDFIFTYPYESVYLRKIFPNKLVFDCDNAVFSRDPLPLCMYADPIGRFKDNFMSRFREQLKCFSITPEQDKKVQTFKTELAELFNQLYNCGHLIEPYKKQFRKIILVPLESQYKMKGVSDFSNDMSVMLYVLQNIPQDVGVIFTYHWGSRCFPRSFMFYLKNKYKNIIYIPELQQFHMASLPLFPYIDAVINLSSTTGIMAMFWDIPVISIGYNFNKWFADSEDLQDINKIIDAPKTNKNNIIYWYLTRYALFEKRFNDSEFLEKYFSNKVAKFNQNGIDFSFYEQIEDFDEISKYILEPVKKYIEKRIMKQKKKKKVSNIQKILSCVNEDNHKVLRILGIKFKFKRKIAAGVK